MVERKWGESSVFPFHFLFSVPWQLRINIFLFLWSWFSFRDFHSKSHLILYLSYLTPEPFLSVVSQEFMNFPVSILSKIPFCPSPLCPTWSFLEPSKFWIPSSPLVPKLLVPPWSWSLSKLFSLILLKGLSCKSQTPKSLSEHLRKLVLYIFCSKTIHSLKPLHTLIFHPLCVSVRQKQSCQQLL